MPAQIRPTRLEVSDRFPMLGFSIRAEGPPQRAEVVLGSEPGLFGPDGKARRTTANFYSTRAAGPLKIAGGEAVFIVPPDVLARFVGKEKLYFGLATVHENEGGAMQVAVRPTDASPYVSLKGLTGRSMHRVRVLPNRQQRAAGYNNNGQASLEWAGDDATPGMEPARSNGGASAAPDTVPKTNGNGSGTARAAPSEAVPYDDGFGPLPARTAPQTQPSPTGNGGAQPVPAQALDASLVPFTGKPIPVTAPAVKRLGAFQKSLIQTALGLFTGPLAPLLQALPGAASAASVSIGVGAATSPGLGQGGALGIGLILGADGEFGVYGTEEIDFSLIASITGTVQITVTRGGIENFSRWNTATTISAGGDLIGGAFALFDNTSFQGVTVGLRIGADFSPVDFFTGVQRGLATGLAMGQTGTGRGRAAGRTFAAGDIAASGDALPLTEPPAPRARAMGGGADAAIAIGGFIVESVRDSSGDVTWELDQFAQRKHPNDVAPTNPAPYRDATTIRLDKWPVSGGVIDDISAWFSVDWQYNGTSLGNIRIGNIGTNDAIGWALHVRAQIMDDNILYQPGPCAALRVRFHYRFSRSIGSDVIAVTELHLYGDGTYEQSSQWLQSSALALAEPGTQTRMTSQAQRTRLAQAMVVGLEDRQKARKYGRDYMDIFQWDPPTDVVNEITRRGFSVQTLDAAVGDLNLDFYKVLIRRFPAGWDGPKLLEHFIRNIDSFINTTYCDFTPYEAVDEQRLASANPRGTVFFLDMLGPDNAAIVISDKQKQFYVVTTINTPRTGDHPVSGHRQFGYILEGPKTTFYTRGADRATLGFPGTERAIFKGGELLWESFQSKLADFINDNGGDAEVLDPFSERFDAQAIREELGKFAGAQSLASRAMAAESFTVNWDDVELVAQPTDYSCWAAAGAMIVGWRDRVSLTPDTVAKTCKRSTASGLLTDDNSKFASEMGLTAAPPVCYTEDSFRTLLANNGPLWVSEGVPPNLHAIVVTGMYSDGNKTYVRIADPWDRVVGTPGKPGAYAETHATGSRYIMGWDEFTQQYEAAITGDPPNRQILHSGNPNGLTANTGQTTPPPGYVQAYLPTQATRALARGQAAGDISASGDALPLAEPPPVRSRAMDAGVSAAIAIGGFLLTSIRDSAGDVTWELDQFAQRKHPNDVAPANPAPYRDAPTIRLDKWPVSGGVIDDISAWFSVDWQYNGTSLGNIRIGNIGTNDAVGWGLHVRAQIMDDNILYQPGPCAALRVRFHYRFTRSIGSDVLAMTELHLYGDGTYEQSSQWLQSSALALNQPQRRLADGRAMDAGAVVSAIGIIVGAVTSSSGDVSWELDAFNQIKNPNDVAPKNPKPFVSAEPIKIEDWTLGWLDKIGADFNIYWQYNGVSIGNINIENTYVNDAIGVGLKVKATISHDNTVYDNRTRMFHVLPDGTSLYLMRSDGAVATPDMSRQPCASMKIHFDFTWDQFVGPAHKAAIDVQLFGDGTYARYGRWIQHSFL